jgi:hypothetical protein
MHTRDVATRGQARYAVHTLVVHMVRKTQAPVDKLAMSDTM